MPIYDQFSIIQNLQPSPIPQTSFLVGIFFRFLQQDSSKKLFVGLFITDIVNEKAS